MSEYDPTARSEVSDYVYDRAKRLEDVMTRLRHCEVIFDHCKQEQSIPAVQWKPIDNPLEERRVVLTRPFLDGMAKVVVALYSDLRDAGEEVLAADIFDQDRNARHEQEPLTTDEFQTMLERKNPTDQTS